MGKFSFYRRLVSLLNVHWIDSKFLIAVFVAPAVYNYWDKGNLYNICPNILMLLVVIIYERHKYDQPLKILRVHIPEKGKTQFIVEPSKRFTINSRVAILYKENCYSLPKIIGWGYVINIHNKDSSNPSDHFLTVSIDRTFDLKLKRRLERNDFGILEKTYVSHIQNKRS